MIFSESQQELRQARAIADDVFGELAKFFFRGDRVMVVFHEREE